MITNKKNKKMKTFKILLLLVTCMLISSCSCSMKMTVSGNPGTEIYKPNGEKIATISNDGKANVELECLRYYGFLLSKDPYTGKTMPFALDWERCYRNDYAWALATAVPTILVGEVVFLMRNNQMAHMHNYKYLPEQRTNEDIQTSGLISPQPVKVLESE